MIHSALHAGHVIPFIGSGASPAVRDEGDSWKKGMKNYLPTPRDLATHLAWAATLPEEEGADRGDLTMVAQWYDVVGGRQALERELHEIFEVECKPTALHQYLAAVEANLLVVTTNYDDLIERAFDSARNGNGHPYDLVIHRTSTSGSRFFLRRCGETELHTVSRKELLDLELEKRSVIYKMHGDWHNDEYVITEDDYIDFLGRMIGGRAIPQVFAEPFQSRHFLFLGYGLRDWNLRVVLSRIRSEHGHKRNINWWAIDAKPAQVQVELWAKRGVDVYAMTIEEFVAEMKQL
jgi:SIR2-like domain